MTITSAREFLSCVKPDNYERAVKNLSGWTERALWDWVKENPHNWNSYEYDALMADNREGQIIWEKQDFLGRYFRDNPQKYLDFVIEKGLVDLPELWRWERNLTLSKIEKRLKPVNPPSDIVFGLGNGYNNDAYKNSIQFLQKEIGILAADGIYDKQTATRLYRAKERKIATGLGYLAHEVNPDLLFDSYYREPQVYGINRQLWRDMDFNDNDLVRDDIQHIEPGSAANFFSSTVSVFGTGMEEVKNNLTARSQKGAMIDSQLINSYGEVGKVLKRLGTIFQFAEPIEEQLADGELNLGKLVKEVGIVGAEVAIAAPLTAGLLGWMTLEFKLNDGTSWRHTVRNTGIKFGTEMGTFWAVGETIEYVFTKEFWDNVSAYLQEEHRKDLDAGIRMD